MTDLEKVINAIQICYTLGHNCTECQFFSEDDCNDKLMQDVLALLKAQEPRVLTLDDALEADVCWLEKKGDDRVWPCKVGGGEKWVAVWRFDQETTVMRRDEYGKRFRCWTAQPTDEQRKAVKLDG